MKILFSLSALSLLLFSLATPVLAATQPLGNSTAAAFGLVPCGNGNATDLQKEFDPNASGDQSNSSCNFFALVVLIKNVTNFLIVLSAPIFVGILVYVGFMLIRHAYAPEKLNRAKEIFKNTLFAFIIIITAWLIVHIIAVTFLNSSFNMFLQ